MTSMPLNNPKQIQSCVTQFLKEKNDEKLIAEFELEPFIVNVLSFERTYFEKVLSVNRLSYAGRNALTEKVRHFYDIYKLQNHPALKDKILTPAYFQLLAAARQNDENNRTMQGEWINKELGAPPLFSDLEAVWQGITADYQKDMSELVY